MLWGVFSADGADKGGTIVSEMSSFPAMEASGITHVLRIKIRVLGNWFWGWRCQVDDRLWGQCLDHLGRGGCRVVLVREGDCSDLD